MNATVNSFGISQRVRPKMIIVYISLSSGSLAKSFNNGVNTSNISITLNCKGIEMLTQALAVGV
ncbi:hypothetical protein VEE09_24190 [Escherichia coli]|nr:hypothetical protein VEGS20_A23470 [Escherichia coli]BEA31346.1 hypothetical protein VEE09_24190 [Escherichia coli]BEB82023.1 hypothetical protein VEE24_23800 [Escherichia coli]